MVGKSILLRRIIWHLNSNYKVLVFKCYKLVFRKKILFEDKENILSLIYFLGFFFGLIIFCFRKFVYINEEVNKLFILEKNIIKESPSIFNI